MKRTAFDDSRDIPAGDEGRSIGTLGPLQCRWCGELTQRSILATYGARCIACYHRYLREPQDSPRSTADKRLGDPKAWAWRLKAREEGGDRLTLAQRNAWRAALHGRASENRTEENAA